MQKLKQRKTYTPTNAPQVCSNCDLSLNKEETLSVAGSKTCFNNPEVDLPQHTGGLKAIVYVKSIINQRKELAIPPPIKIGGFLAILL
jgi:hypothetical protein